MNLSRLLALNLVCVCGQSIVPGRSTKPVPEQGVVAKKRPTSSGFAEFVHSRGRSNLRFEGPDRERMIIPPEQAAAPAGEHPAGEQRSEAGQRPSE